MAPADDPPSAMLASWKTMQAIDSPLKARPYIDVRLIAWQHVSQQLRLIQTTRNALSGAGVDK